MNEQKLVNVWDPLVRIFHWSLVATFTVAYITEDDWLDIHVLAGYAIIFLLIFRLIWGLIGTKYARFSSFLFSPKQVGTYLRHLLKGKGKRYLGHNPAGSAMIFLVLLSLIMVSFTGLLAYGIEEGAGPFASLSAINPSWFDEIAEEVHEFMANFMIGLIIFHIFGVIISSLKHRENLVRAMINGKKVANS